MAITSNPQTIKHNNKSNNRDYNIFLEEYFGGSDAFIYIDGKRVHNIAAISFQVAEQHKPIYGYGSRTYDDLAVGTRIVSGAIRIPVQNKEASSLGDTLTRTVSTPETSPTIVPEWVYNYEPEKEDNVTIIENEDSDTLSMVARVQEKLNLEVTGFVDEATRKEVTQYRIDNGMILGTLIDNELLSMLEVEDYQCWATRRILLYDSPEKDSSISVIEKDESLVFIASDNNTVMVRTENGLAGYVGINEVYRS